MKEMLSNAAYRILAYFMLTSIVLLIALGPGMVVVEANDWPLTTMHVLIGAAIWWGCFFGLFLILSLAFGTDWFT